MITGISLADKILPINRSYRSMGEMVVWTFTYDSEEIEGSNFIGNGQTDDWNSSNTNLTLSLLKPNRSVCMRSLNTLPSILSELRHRKTIRLGYFVLWVKLGSKTRYTSRITSMGSSQDLLLANSSICFDEECTWELCCRLFGSMYSFRKVCFIVF